MNARRLASAAVVVAALALALAGGEASSIVARACGLALALASLVVLTGWSGQLNLHVAAIGLGWGAYAMAGLAANGVPPLVAIAITPLVVAPFAFVVGAIAVRFRGLELAIATLAAGLACEQMAFRTLGRWLGHAGAQGTAFQSSLVSVARPGWFASDRAYALLALAVAGLWFGIAAFAGRGGPGRTMRVVRDREIVAEARGVATFWWRAGAFVLAIAIASVGGALAAAQTGAVTPEAFSFTLSLQLLAVATLCGIRRLDGALLGAVLIVLTQEAGGVRAFSWFSGERTDLIFGAGLIAVLALRARARERAPSVAAAEYVAPPVAPAARASAPAFAPTVLRVEQVRVAFGVARILDGVDLRVGEGEVVGLVGGNGAGKTTLFNCITGLVRPDAGSVFLGGDDITEMAPHRRAHLGLARTFQGVEVFESLTVLEGLMVGAGLRSRGADETVLAQRARAALAEVGIAHLADESPATLPFASLRLVEIASALVPDPALVLLDEPLAGLDANERARVLVAVEHLRARRRSVLLVEHDRASVDRIADRVYELRDGRAHERTAPAPAPAAARSTRRGGSVAARV